jgi:hypothetical protein
MHKAKIGDEMGADRNSGNEKRTMKDLTFKQKGAMAAAAVIGLAGVVGVGAEAAKNISPEIDKRITGIENELFMNPTERVESESGFATITIDDSGDVLGTYDIFEMSGWNNGSFDVSYYEEALRGLKANDGVDLAHLKPGDKVIYYKKTVE